MALTVSPFHVPCDRAPHFLSDRASRVGVPQALGISSSTPCLRSGLHGFTATPRTSAEPLDLKLGIEPKFILPAADLTSAAVLQASLTLRIKT